jgi:hypothetical protein
MILHAAADSATLLVVLGLVYHACLLEDSEVCLVDLPV